MKIVKSIFDAVFSFGGGMTLFGIGAVILMISIASSSANASAQCVQAGMVKVHYDGANYCVAPADMIRVTAK